MGKRSGSGGTGGSATGTPRGIVNMTVASIARDTADEMENLKRANVDWWKKEIQRVGISKIDPPLIGYKKGGKVTIINGRHRFTAAKELGYKTIPVKVSGE